MYRKGDFLVTEGEIFITTNDGRLILLREHPIANPNFSIKCSEYFGTNYINIKTTVQHKQLSLTNGTVIDKENHAVTDFISVDELKEYAFTSASSFFRIAFYDANKQFISSESTEVVFNQRWIEDLPSNAKFIRISAEYFTIQSWGLYELTNERAFAITYFDKKVEVHLPDFYGVTRALVGTPDLFSLSYISDTKDKGQTIMATEADINIYQDDYFNIDNLATSGETDIKIQYYESDLLVWSGFVIPDFFEVDIKPNPIISMVATDRLGVLKEIDFKGERPIPRDIVLDCLANTGLTLDSTIIYQNSYFETTTINLERYDGMSCYDVLTSVLTAFNAKVVQYGNKWNIVNKLTLETRQTSNIIQIGLVDVNGRREIKPVASEVSMKMEFGGSKKYPKNWNFENYDISNVYNPFYDWLSLSFISSPYNRNIGSYILNDGNIEINKNDSQPSENTSLYFNSRHSLFFIDDDFYTHSHIMSSWNNVYFLDNKTEITTKLNFTSVKNIHVNGSIVFRITTDGKPTRYQIYTRDMNGELISAGETNLNIPYRGVIWFEPSTSSDEGELKPIQTINESTFSFTKNSFGISDDDVATVDVAFIIYGERFAGELEFTGYVDILIHSVEFLFNESQVTGKGLIFKIKQGGDKFSKVRETQTTLFSDKITQGINGYFYNYKYDDTSIANLPNEFILQNTLREQAQMFSKARDFLSLSGNIKVNPLARYICGEKQYVLVGGTSGRKKASVQLEEIVDENLTKIDYIYTYFD